MTSVVANQSAAPRWVADDRVRDLTEQQWDDMIAAVQAGAFAPRFGQSFVMSGGPLAGRRFEWNGESFGGFNVMALQSSFAPASRSSENGANDSAWVALASFRVPGFLMRRNSTLRITNNWAFQKTTSTKIFGIFLNGTSIAGPSTNNNAIETAKYVMEITNANSVSAQIVFNSTGPGNSGNPFIVSGTDTRSSFSLQFSARWSAATLSETITLMGYMIELVP